MASVKMFNFRSSESASAIAETQSNNSLMPRLFETFEASGGWFWATDAQGKLTYLSKSMAAMLGQTHNRLIGEEFVNLFCAPPSETNARNRLPFTLSRKSNFDRLALQTTHVEGMRWWDVSGRVCHDAADNFSGYIGFAVDITGQHASSQSASKLALFDAVTGLPNRLNMSNYLKQHLGAGRQGAIFALGLDRFKAVNDTLGHAAGDALLKQVASRLVKTIGDREKVFRLGGDEFQIVLPGTHDQDDLSLTAQSIISDLSQPYSIDGTRCVIGVSVGLATSTHDGHDSDDLMRMADLALDAAKNSGRGCFRFFSHSLLQLAEERRLLEEDLRDALGKGELSLFYQPQVSTSSETVTGVEALIRWTHPKRGAVSPALFIPIAEEANLIEALGEWIIRQACVDAAAWPSEIKVAINVSPIQFANAALPSIVISALAKSGLLPSRLELELTEGVFLTESDETNTMFANLKAIGVRLALDDFGTGYSSLGYLKTAPFDKIKIDQSFVRDATEPGSRNGAIIAAIVALAGALDMETTAEGIETLDQLDLMRELGVSHIQGYVYSKAVSNETLCDKLGDGKWAINPTGPAKHRSDRRTLYRKAAAIVAGHYHPVLVRNLSESGALIEGLMEVQVGTQIILDLGDGQLELARVRRETVRGHGIAFGQTLVKDGSGVLETKSRIAPYILAKNGLLGAAQSGQSKNWDPSGTISIEVLANILGLTPMHAARVSSAQSDGHNHGTAGLYTSDAHYLTREVLVTSNPLQNLALLNTSSNSHPLLTAEEWDRLKSSVEESQNTQLKFIIALVVLTGARFQELLTATWDDVDPNRRCWTVNASNASERRKIRLSEGAMEILKTLARTPECNYMIVNPRTKKPFNSVFGSWDAARKKAGLDNISIHDLRKSIKHTG